MHRRTYGEIPVCTAVVRPVLCVVCVLGGSEFNTIHLLCVGRLHQQPLCRLVSGATSLPADNVGLVVDKYSV